MKLTVCTGLGWLTIWFPGGGAWELGSGNTFVLLRRRVNCFLFYFNWHMFPYRKAGWQWSGFFTRGRRKGFFLRKKSPPWISNGAPLIDKHRPLIALVHRQKFLPEGCKIFSFLQRIWFITTLNGELQLDHDVRWRRVTMVTLGTEKKTASYSIFSFTFIGCDEQKKEENWYVGIVADRIDM